jgi:cell division control protein 24
MQTILLKCRNDEHLRQWLEVIIDLKKTSNKLDFFSSSSPQQQLLHYDEDEEDYDNLSEDEEHPMRHRSYSYQYQPNRFPEVTTRKTSFSHHPGRHFMNGVPGMSLPPLPRSPTTNVPTLSNASVSTVHSTELYSPISFPSSPPMSYPSSPTQEPLWQRRQSHKEEEDPIPLRLRSQSSPNIQRPASSAAKEQRRKSKYDEITKLKVHYFGAVYIVVVPNDIGFTDLQKRIESKIKLCASSLKYEDEDGDLITISSSEDVQMGFENKGPNNSVNLYVTS